MNTKPVILLVLIVFMAAAGCAEKSDEQVGSALSPNETESVDDVQLADETNQITSGTLDSVEKVPELQIVSVTSEDNGINIKVKNTGNATAEDVYCGVVLYGASNSRAFYEYMTIEELKEIVLPAIKGGMTGETFDYETGYRFNDAPNLIVSYRLIGIDYIGDIDADQTGIGSMDIVDYGTSRSEFLKAAWMAGNEENFVIY